MSLINDVLKDLERRDAPEAARAAPPAERRRPSVMSPAWKWPLWLIAALAVGIVLHLSLSQGSPPDPSQEPVRLVAQADPPHSEPEPAAGEDDRAATNEQATSPRPIDWSASDSRPDEPPPSTSAALVQSSDRQPPGHGTDAAATAGETEADQPARVESPQPEPQPEVEPRRDPDPAPAPSASRPEPEPAAQESQTEQPTISIRRSSESAGSSDPVAAAKRFLGRGQLQRAESRLRKLVDEQPGLTEAHELLANTLIRQRRPDAAVRVLETGLSEARDPAPLAALLGRLLIERGEVMRARTVLQTHAPAVTESPDYHLLLAAAHRQAGDHEAAAAHYRKLTEALPRRGAAWLGLGTSLESLQRPEEAVEAYNRAVDGDDARAARFARQRLIALEPITGETP